MLYLMAPDGVAVDPLFVSHAVNQGVRVSRKWATSACSRLSSRRGRPERTGPILRPSWFNQNFDEGFFREAVVAGEAALPIVTFVKPSSTPPATSPR